MEPEDFEVLKSQRDGLKRKLATQNRWAIRPAAAGIFLLGAAIMAIWYLTNDDSTMSMLVFLAGVALMSLAVLLYFLSPARYLRAEVSDGEALANTLNVGKILSGLMIEARGIYIPASQAGSTKVFLPASEEGPIEVPKATGSVFIAPRSGGAKGILLDPPGYGLLAHARQIGAAFTDEGLENELKDMLENGMELARTVAVKRDGDEIAVSMRDIANAGMCASVRKEQPELCVRTGCPLCSFVACAVAEGTGRMVRVKSVDVEGRTVQATFELM